MSLPMSKLVCGMGDAPVTGAWMPITISESVTPAVSFPPGSNGPLGAGAVVVAATVVVAPGAVVVAPGAVVVPGVVVAPDAVVGATGAAVMGGRVDPVVVADPPPSSAVPATPDF